mmetsp:Transcript_11799/g.19375  ORF Transcript_11799/g.19375 Transcript_11799/m.19375 type:complete len:359 (+) Transcript_11799:39-1115(+)
MSSCWGEWQWSSWDDREDEYSEAGETSWDAREDGWRRAGQSWREETWREVSLRGASRFGIPWDAWRSLSETHRDEDSDVRYLENMRMRQQIADLQEKMTEASARAANAEAQVALLSQQMLSLNTDFAWQEYGSCSSSSWMLEPYMEESWTTTCQVPLQSYHTVMNGRPFCMLCQEMDVGEEHFLSPEHQRKERVFGSPRCFSWRNDTLFCLRCNKYTSAEHVRTDRHRDRCHLGPVPPKVTPLALPDAPVMRPAPPAEAPPSGLSESLDVADPQRIWQPYDACLRGSADRPKVKGVALADFDGAEFGDEYISLQRGCEVQLHDGEDHEGWSLGRRMSDGRQGWFPTEYVAYPRRAEAE